MKVLVFGASGSGKTYVSGTLHRLGINAFDADEIEGLSAWYDTHGNKVTPPQNAGEAIAKQYSFCWSKRFLKNFLKQFSDVYLFGGSGNMFHMFDLFDKIYFLKVKPELQRGRLRHASRKNPAMDTTEEGVFVWGDWLEEEAGKRGILCIDASLTPEQIFNIIR